MSHRSTALAILAVVALVFGGCTSDSGDEESTETASPSASAEDGTQDADDEGGDGGEASDGADAGEDGSAGGSANGEAAGANTTSTIDPDAGTNNPSATVEWGSSEQEFLLVICDNQGPSSLAASGDDLRAGSILTLKVEDGSGLAVIEADATLEEEFYGEITSFSSNGSTFEASGNYEADDQTGPFTMRGDCKDL